MAIPVLPLAALGFGLLLLSGGKRSRASGAAALPPRPQPPPNIPPEPPEPANVPKRPPQGVSIKPEAPPIPEEPEDLAPFISIGDLQAGLMIARYDIGSFGVDGVWGRDTSEAVAAFQSDQDLSATGIPDRTTRVALFNLVEGEPDLFPDECDALLAPPIGKICVPDITGRFILEDEYAYINRGKLPNVDAGYRSFVIRMSPDLSKMDIGIHWRWKTLEPWLLRKKREGKVGVSSAKTTLAWLEETFVSDPSKFLGFGNETAGGFVYMGLAIVSGVGLGLRIIPAIGSKFGENAAKAAIVGSAAAGTAEFAASTAGLFHALAVEKKDVLLLAQMMMLTQEFIKTHHVLVGDHWVRIADLPMFPLGLPYDQLMRVVSSATGNTQIPQNPTVGWIVENGIDFSDPNIPKTNTWILLERIMVWISIFQRYEIK